MSTFAAAVAHRHLQRLGARADARSGSVELRLATASDQSTLDRLAALETDASLRGPALIGLVDGRAAAALDLTTGRVVADPFQPTAHVAELLRAQRSQLMGPGASHARRGALLARLAR